jgi:hypothetical protein
MSPVILTPPPVPPPADPASTAPATLTVTFYRQLAAHFSEAIDEIAAIIPRMEQAVPTGRFVRTHLNVPLKFLSTCISSIEEVPELQVIRKLDVERGLDTLQLIDAFRPIRDKVTGFLKDLENALNTRQAALAVEALDTYDLAKSLARDPKSAALTAWVANMQRDLGKRGPKARKPAPPIEMVPVPLSTATWVPEKPQRGNG